MASKVFLKVRDLSLSWFSEVLTFIFGLEVSKSRKRWDVGGGGSDAGTEMTSGVVGKLWRHSESDRVSWKFEDTVRAVSSLEDWRWFWDLTMVILDVFSRLSGLNRI